MTSYMWNPKKEQTRPNLMDTDSWLPEANIVRGGKIGEGGYKFIKKKKWKRKRRKRRRKANRNKNKN